jgi:hypothetical protein
MSTPKANSWRFYRHMPVYLAGGRRLGFVVEVGHGVDYLHVQQGRFLVRDWYISLDAVSVVDAGGVRLSVRLADLRRRRYNVPPADFLLRQGATPGYEYTSKADLPVYGAAQPASKRP